MSDPSFDRLLSWYGRLKAVSFEARTQSMNVLMQSICFKCTVSSEGFHDSITLHSTVK